MSHLFLDRVISSRCDPIAVWGAKQRRRGGHWVVCEVGRVRGQSECRTLREAPRKQLGVYDRSRVHTGHGTWWRGFRPALDGCLLERRSIGLSSMSCTLASGACATRLAWRHLRTARSASRSPCESRKSKVRDVWSSAGGYTPTGKTVRQSVSGGGRWGRGLCAPAVKDGGAGRAVRPDFAAPAAQARTCGSRGAVFGSLVCVQ